MDARNRRKLLHQKLKAGNGSTNSTSEGDRDGGIEKATRALLAKKRKRPLHSSIDEMNGALSDASTETTRQGADGEPVASPARGTSRTAHTLPGDVSDTEKSKMISGQVYTHGIT